MLLFTTKEEVKKRIDMLLFTTKEEGSKEEESHVLVSLLFIILMSTFP